VKPHEITTVKNALLHGVQHCYQFCDKRGAAPLSSCVRMYWTETAATAAGSTAHCLDAPAI